MNDLLEGLLDMEKTLGEHPWGAVCADVRDEIARLQAVLDAAREIRALASGAYHGTYSVSSEKFKQLMDAIHAYDEGEP